MEVLSLADLRERAPVRLGKGRLTLPQRPDFHHLLTLSEGHLRHMVDFTGYTLEPGSWLWVRPGQVQQWGDIEQAEGTLILFERDFLDLPTVTLSRLDEPSPPPPSSHQWAKTASHSGPRQRIWKANGTIGEACRWKPMCSSCAKCSVR
ncbi:hypothetical protein [Actinacidiphila glaucinigra]|uniref:hypothetical protein n=1 Tax=Actinacidiphila glaucinigra TaxID=235986 RepID=UPI003D8C0E71